jgi:hypothetical protein
MLELPTVTLSSVVTRKHHETRQALDLCRQRIRPRNTVIFTDDPTHFEGADIIPIKRFERWEDVSVWSLTVAPRLVCQHSELFGSHLMGFHWDGFVINTAAWTDQWLEYDFIGASWPDGIVGNDGFCLKSMRWLDALRGLNLPNTYDACHPSDGLTCRMEELDGRPGYRRRMEVRGMKIASFEATRTFSRENEELPTDNLPFGFHGTMCLAQVKALGLAPT